MTTTERVRTGRAGARTTVLVSWRGTIEIDLPGTRLARSEYLRQAWEAHQSLVRVPALLGEADRDGQPVFAVELPGPHGDRWTTLSAESFGYSQAEIGCREAENLDGSDVSAEIGARIDRALSAE